MKIELKKVSINTRMSEETVCFIADLYVDGVKAAEVKNQGHGGNTSIHPFNILGNELVKRAEIYCRTLPPDISEVGGFSLDMDLEFYIDLMVDKIVNEKEKKKFAAKLAKECINNICYGKPGVSFTGFGWKYLTIETAMANPHIRGAMVKTIARIKSELKPGESILNTNLGDLL